jgi:hypothetical protein
MPRHTITVSDTQLRVLIRVTEAFSRICSGQLFAVIDALPLKKEVRYDDVNCRMRYALDGLMEGDIDGIRSTLGIANDEVEIEAKIAWDLYQVLRHHESWGRAVDDGIIESMSSQRKWPEMMSVVFDDPLPVCDERLATISLIDEKGATK